VTIATLMPGRLRTLADVHQQVKHDMCQHKAPRTWLRDEKANAMALIASLKPETLPDRKRVIMRGL
jgi:hypothetical protein